jgi:hypothetical protein
MRPDRTNYEVWLIDYLDGNLTSGQVELLNEFLAENPDLKEEFEGLSSVYLPVPDRSFMNKNSLRRSAGELSESQFELLCAASLEKDLTPEQQAELDEVISASEEKRKTALLFSKTKVSAPDIRYRYKSRLRKLTAGQKVIRLTATGLSAAATILILFTIIRNPQGTVTVTPGSRLISLTDNDSLEKNTRNVNDISHEEKIVPAKKEDKKNNQAVTLFAKIDKTIASEMKSFNEKSLSPDSSLKVVAALKTDIEKIGGITEIPSESKPLNLSLVSMNLPQADPYYDDPENAVGNFFARVVREKILKSETAEKGNLKAYEVADAGITGINKLFGSNMTLKRTTDENGDVKSVYFSSKLIKFNAPVKKVAMEP